MEKREKAIAGVGLGLATAGVLLLATRAKAKPPVPLPPPPPGLAHLSGQVTSADKGYPQQDVKVTLDGKVYNTDAEGLYIFFDLVPGSYTVTFEKSDYETGSFSIVLVEGLNELNVQLVPIAPPEEPEISNIYGRVIDKEKEPISGVLITLNGYSTYTNSDGYFSFTDLPSGYYTITLEKEGYLPLGDTGEIPAGEYDSGDWTMGLVPPPPPPPPPPPTEWNYYANYPHNVVGLHLPTELFSTREELDAYLASFPVDKGDLGGRILAVIVPKVIQPGQSFPVEYILYLSYCPTYICNRGTPDTYVFMVNVGPAYYMGRAFPAHVATSFPAPSKGSPYEVIKGTIMVGTIWFGLFQPPPSDEWECTVPCWQGDERVATTERLILPYPNY